MKKLLLLLLFTTSFVRAQDPEIFDTTWYLYSYYQDVVNVSSDADPCDDPLFIYFETDNTFYGRSSCSEFTGNWTYDATEQRFLLQNFQNTDLIPCGNTCYNDPQQQPSNIDFYYLGFLSEHSDSDCIVSISVQSFGNSSQMWMDSCVWQRLTFGDTPLPILSTEDFSKSVFSIYPNPTQNTFNVSSPKNIPVKSWGIYSSLGKRIMEKNGPALNSIDISGLSDGLYFIELVSDEGSEIHKIIKG